MNSLAEDNRIIELLRLKLLRAFKAGQLQPLLRPILIFLFNGERRKKSFR